jgi:hypothetical protein
MKKFIAAVAIIAAVIVTFAPDHARAQSDQPLKPEQLDQLVAPIALYPDALLAQVLIASTYPLEIVEASRWVKQNANLKDQQLDAALEKKDWDPSVEALTHFPSVLEQMNEKLEWTQQIGDAFIAQQADVMDSVQRLRRQAHEAGHLKSTEQQKVVVEGQTIVIESANPQVVYVPAYNPTVVYGTWAYPAYPPYYWPPPPGYTFASGVAWGVGFGVGIAMTAAIFDGFDWNNHDVNVNVNRNTNINRQNVDAKKWQHDPAHRKGVNYRDQASREKYGGADRRAAESRKDFRGHDQRPEARRDGGPGQASQRDGRQGVERGQGDRAGAAGRDAPGGDRAQARDQRQPAAFDRQGGGQQAQRDSARGQASRQSMAQSRGGGGARGGGGRRR